MNPSDRTSAELLPPAPPHDVVVLMDASGSMERRVDMAVKTLNADILPPLRQLVGTFSLILFNTKTQSVLWKIPLATVPTIKSFPVGDGTYLYEAIIKTISEACAMGMRGTFVVITDGKDEDNRKNKSTPNQVSAAFKMAREMGWTIRVVEVDVRCAHVFGAKENDGEILRARSEYHDTFREAMTQATRHIKVPRIITADYTISSTDHSISDGSGSSTQRGTKVIPVKIQVNRNSFSNLISRIFKCARNLARIK